MHIAVINGPNLNRLGRRRPERYGQVTLADITTDLDRVAAEVGDLTLSHRQSNHEGDLIDWLHEVQDTLDAVVVNPAGLTPYGRSLCDTLSDTGLPVGVVHITQLYRHYGTDAADLYRALATSYVCGLGWRGYRVSVLGLVDVLRGREGLPDTPSTAPAWSG